MEGCRGKDYTPNISFELEVLVEKFGYIPLKNQLTQQLIKRAYKTLGTSVIYSPMSNPSLKIILFLGNNK